MNAFGPMLTTAPSATMQFLHLSSKDNFMVWQHDPIPFTSYLLKLCILPVRMWYVVFMPNLNIQIRVKPHCRSFQPRTATQTDRSCLADMSTKRETNQNIFMDGKRVSKSEINAVTTVVSVLCNTTCKQQRTHLVLQGQH